MMPEFCGGNLAWSICLYSQGGFMRKYVKGVVSRKVVVISDQRTVKKSFDNATASLFYHFLFLIGEA